MLNLFATNLIFHESLHLILAIIISFIIFRKFNSIKLIFIVFTVTFLIDIDHFTEGFLIYGANLNWISNFQGNYFRESGKMTIFFHSWELLLPILFFGQKFKKWPLVVSITLAAIGHILIDQLVYTSIYGLPILEYSLTYRAIHGFTWLKICGGCQ